MVVYNKDNVDEIIFELLNGKLVVLPTDTVYGVISLDQEQIYKFKKRSKNKKIIKFVYSSNEIKNANEDVKLICEKFWPGQLTIVFNGKSYRKPNNELIIKILKKFKSIYCSSANISGLKTIKNINELNKQFGNNLSNVVFVNNDVYQSDKPSTIYDFDNKKILREGIITLGDINECLQKNNNR